MSDFAENLVENAFELWFDSVLEKNGLDRDDFEKGVVELRSSFAGAQFDELKAGETDSEVLINEGAPDVEVAEKEVVTEEGERQQVLAAEPQDIDRDSGYFVMIRMDDGFLCNFDFRRNRSYQAPLLEAADQFLILAEYAIDQELWRGFVENAFHASERLMKIEAIWPPGMKAERHGEVRDAFESFSKGDEVKEDLLAVYDELNDTYRKSGTYVDPLGDVPERDFELSEEEAQEMLNSIRSYRVSLQLEAQPNTSSE